MGMPGQKKWPFLPQNKFVFISARLASCKQGKKRPRLRVWDWWGCRAWKARSFCSPKSQPLGCRLYPALLGPRVENHISPWWAGCLQEDDCKQMYPCSHVKGIPALVSAVLHHEHPAPGSILGLLNSLQVLGTSMCWYSRAGTQEGQHIWGQQEGQRPKAGPADSPYCRLGFISIHFPGKHPLCLKLHKVVAAKLCFATTAMVSTSCYGWPRRNTQDGHS